MLGGLLGRKAGVDAASASSAPSLSSMLDLNGDGNPLDDILRIVGKVLR